MDDRTHFLCNLCSGKHTDCVLTESDPARGLAVGDTYHFEHLPPNIGFHRVARYADKDDQHGMCAPSLGVKQEKP